MKNYDFSDIFAALEQLEVVSEKCDEGTLNAQFFINEVLSQKTYSEVIGSAEIFCEKDAIIQYMQWFFFQNQEESAADRIDMLLSELSGKFWPTDTVLIQPIDVQLVLEKINALFPQFKKILELCSLQILIFDAQHESRSAESTAIFGKTFMQGVIRFYQMQTNVGSFEPIHVFLHELGHILHMYATRSLKTVLESFHQYLKSCGADVSAFSAEQLLEVFADTFLMAVTSQFDDLGDPFPEINADIKQRCFFYIKSFLNQLI